MVVAKRVEKAKKKKNKSSIKVRHSDLPDVSLSSSLSKSAENLSAYSIWIYSDPGLGKTTFTARFPKTHHFMFEPGAKSLRIHQRRVNDWPEFVAYMDLWEKDKTFKTATIDVVEHAFQMCLEYMCDYLGIEDPSEEKDYGKSWGAIYTEFIKQITRPMYCRGKGVIYVSHASQKEFTSVTGEKYAMTRPAMRDKPMGILMGLVDILGYIRNQGDVNTMLIRTDGTAWAKCRPENKFLYTSGRMLGEFEMGDNADEAYQNFVRAFNNKFKEPVAKKKKKKSLKLAG